MTDSTTLLETSFPLIKSEYNGPTNTELTSLTIGQYLKRIVDNYSNNLAIVVRHQNIRWSYREYWEQVESVACGLLSDGVKPGDRVGI